MASAAENAPMTDEAARPSTPPSRPLTLIAVTSAAQSSGVEAVDSGLEIHRLQNTESSYSEQLCVHHAAGCDMDTFLSVLNGTRSRWNKPDILHFIGHGLVNWIDTRSGRIGSMPMLLTTTDHKHTKQPDFYDPDGVLKSINISVVRDRKPRLVVLQGCKTFDFAKKLVQATPSMIVICWRSLLLDQGCHVFSEILYKNICDALRKRQVCTADDVLHAFVVARNNVCSQFFVADPESESGVFQSGFHKPILGVPVFIAGRDVAYSDVFFSQSSQLSEGSTESVVSSESEEEVDDVEDGGGASALPSRLRRRKGSMGSLDEDARSVSPPSPVATNAFAAPMRGTVRGGGVLSAEFGPEGSPPAAANNSNSDAASVASSRSQSGHSVGLMRREPGDGVIARFIRRQRLSGSSVLNNDSVYEEDKEVPCLGMQYFIGQDVLPRIVAPAPSGFASPPAAASAFPSMPADGTPLLHRTTYRAGPDLVMDGSGQAYVSSRPAETYGGLRLVPAAVMADAAAAAAAAAAGGDDCGIKLTAEGNMVSVRITRTGLVFLVPAVDNTPEEKELRLESTVLLNKFRAKRVKMRILQRAVDDVNAQLQMHIDGREIPDFELRFDAANLMSSFVTRYREETADLERAAAAERLAAAPPPPPPRPFFLARESDIGAVVARHEAQGGLQVDQRLCPLCNYVNSIYLPTCERPTCNFNFGDAAGQ